MSNKKIIYIVIGQSASGKTTFVKNTFLKGDILLIEKPIKHTLIDNGKILLIGDYTDNTKRCTGTDQLSMSILPQLIEFIKIKINEINVLVVEGDRINNQRFFEFIKSLNIPVELKYFYCSIQESMQRRLETGSNPNETFVKTTRTKSERMKLLAKELGFNVEEINTGKIKEIRQQTLF